MTIIDTDEEIIVAKLLIFIMNLSQMSILWGHQTASTR